MVDSGPDTGAQAPDFAGLLRRSVQALLDEQVARAGDAFFFVQIGAHDGVNFDWVHEFVRVRRLSGLVVEPLPDVFEALRAAYQDHPQVVPVNTAIHRTDREVTMYRVDPAKEAGLPQWAKAIASVDPRHHLRSGTPSDAIVTERVRAMTLQELFDAHDVTRVDFLQIDVEGYDQEIIRMIDFDRLAPAIIRFEHNRRADVMPIEDLQDCVRRLIAADYRILMDDVDAVAYRSG